MIKVRIYDKETRKITMLWMILSLFSMLSSTIYAFLLVITRSGLQMHDDTFFKTALVLHVTFSVLIWFFSITGMLWSIFCGAHMLRTGWTSISLALSGAFLLTLTPLQEHTSPLLNDYIPVLQQPLFYLALILFATGTVLGALRVMVTGLSRKRTDGYSPIYHVAMSSAAITLCGIFLIPAAWLAEGTSATVNLQRLFWGSGHVLLLSHVLIMLATWFWLTSTTTKTRNIHPGIRNGISGITLLAVASPLLYLSNSAYPGQHIWQSLFTWLMAGSGCIAIYIAISIIIPWLRSFSALKDWRYILLPAVVLFSTGNLLGIFIRENNALVPAHYHGVIGAITLSFMGLIYALLPILGYSRPSRTRIATQSLVYSGGLILMMIGLVISDIPRKAISKVHSAEHNDVIGHIIMGTGGFMALTGSVFFLALVIRSILKEYQADNLTTESS